jgi:Ca2+-binding EF-hand superfamily protein
MRSFQATPEAQAMKEILQLRKEMMIPMDIMQAAMRLFKEHATVPEDGVVWMEGEMSKAQLANVMRQMAGSSKIELGATRLDNAFVSADKNLNGSISFREFAIWYSSHSFDEDLTLDAEELELRRMSRELDVPPSEIDTYKRHFDSFDTDGNGTMDRTEFYDMMVKCLKVPKHIGLPTNRVQQLWSAADSDGSGEINFAEFVVFFSKYFPQGGLGGSCGMDQYYAQSGLVNTLHGNYGDY